MFTSEEESKAAKQLLASTKLFPVDGDKIQSMLSLIQQHLAVIHAEVGPVAALQLSSSASCETHAQSTDSGARSDFLDGCFKLQQILPFP